VSSKKPPKPVWYKNTFFWIALVLALVAIYGLPFVRGEDSIRDPGQVREGWLVLIYFVGAVVMFVNGVLSHRQTIQHYQEEIEASTEK
jgi:hypothetical protein